MRRSATSGRAGRERGRAGESSGRGVPSPARGASLLYASAVGLFAFLLYANTLGHGYVLDDDIATRRNTFVQQGIAGLDDIFTHGYAFGFNGQNVLYRPVALASLAFDKQFFGNSAGAHHAVNVMIFCLTIVAFHLLLARLFAARRSRATTVNRPTDPATSTGLDPAWVRFVPLAAVLIFAAHPIHTEVVANIKSRDELLSFFFAIAALGLLVRHLDSGSPLAWVGSVVCYLLAALSKESGIAAIGLVPLTIWFFRPASLRRVVTVTAPYLLAAGLFLLLRQVFSDTQPAPASKSIINNALMAAPDAGTWFASRIAVLGRYLMLLVVPYPLSYDYSFNQVPLVGPGAPGFVISLAAYLLLVVVAVLGFTRRDVLSYAIGFFGIMLVLVSNLIVPLGTVMAERLMFAPSAAFCLALAWGLAKGGSRLGGPRS